ncbi:M56 family metallopeptidase [Confluentibacter flavum]|uniref:Peptidase M56 domain-containing protein n=1 Tax=Confluentibacter flavum TaxID=1909700 RepID=A0A2N3HHF7_9FLAO|nr:M56 family metallopeptidase [Confluentibacter flavum]PKQ44400.1 hypothetical protein CSW08_13385 [Confluentibacter flavum]
MEFYVLKSGICLAIFYTFYKLVLEKESFHVFKRFYLLVSAVLAFVIPLITFTEYIEPTAQKFPLTFSDAPITNTIIEVQPINYVPIILWAIYGMGVLLFSIKFFKNLAQLFYKIKHNTKVKIHQFTHVLLQDLIVPHTFFDYIFLNKQKFETHQIPKEVLLHEETHAKQKHSLDVLFIEILHILFWFNPLIYFIKHSIKLNHEFLADNAVLKQGIDSSTYQNILLAFSSPDSNRDATELPLANALNYSSIKKRFTVMKTHTSKQAFWLRSLILLPLLAILIYSFSEKNVIEKSVQINGSTAKSQTIQKSISQITITLNKKAEVTLNDETFHYADLYKKLNALTNGLSEDVKSNIIVNLKVESGTNGLYTSYVKEFIRLIGISKITLNSSSKIQETVPQEINKAFRMVFYLDTDNLTAFGLWLDTNDLRDEMNLRYFKKLKNLTEIEIVVRNGTSEKTISEVEKILMEYGEVNLKFTDGEPWLNKNKQKAAPKEIEEYNNLVKKFNSNPEGERILKVKDKNRIVVIYGLMTMKQKNENELFPDFTTILLPPQPHQQKATLEEIEEYTNIVRKNNFRLHDESTKRQSDIDFIANVYNKMNKEQRVSAEPFPNIIPPPMPPKPLEPENPSQELLQLKKEYNEEANAYAEIVKIYFNEKKESLAELWKIRESTMVLYIKYSALAKKELDSSKDLKKQDVPRPPAKN